MYQGPGQDWPLLSGQTSSLSSQDCWPVSGEALVWSSSQARCSALSWPGSPPAASGSGEDEVADVVGPLEACDDNGFAVRNRRGELVLIPRERAMAAKVIPERA